MARHFYTICCPECGSYKVKMLKTKASFHEGSPEFPVRQVDCVTCLWKCKKCQKVFKDTVMV